MEGVVTMERGMAGFTHRLTTKRGVTLIELLIALVLFAVGATAMAGGMWNATRSASLGRAWMSGAYAAESRFEHLRARCTSAAGAASTGAVAESWAPIRAAGPMLPSVEVLDSITLTTTSGVSSRVVTSTVRCSP
jgi:prepilin-type N-terminal cleavage/methylation domain-containing protein